MLYGSQEDYNVLAGKPTDKPAMTPEQVQEMYEYMGKLNQDLIESGEHVYASGLTAPAHARRVRLESGVPAVTDGPYAETEEVVAGFNIVECESYERAVEIAARFLNPDGEGEYVDVRPVADAAGDFDL